MSEIYVRIMKERMAQAQLAKAMLRDTLLGDSTNYSEIKSGMLAYAKMHLDDEVREMLHTVGGMASAW